VERSKKLSILSSGFPHRVAEKFFFDPLALDWGDTSMEAPLHELLFKAVLNCPIDQRAKLTGNIVLAGGNTLFDGLPQMLYKKLKAAGKERAKQMKVTASPGRGISAWVGGSITASLPTWIDRCVLAEDYDEDGPKAIERMNILAFS
jgi:actin-related protein